MIIGIIYGLYLKISMALFFIIGLLISLAIVNNKRVNKYKKVIFTMIITSLIFTLYINALNNKYEKFYKEIENNITIEAVIISEAKDTKYYKAYTIRARDKRFILYTNKENLKYGTRIKVEGNFSEPEEARNYKGFNYKQYLKSKKIYGSIKSNKMEIVKEDDINLIAKISNNVRNKIIETAEKLLPQETAGTLIGILIGNKEQIPDNIKESFRSSSLAHILAISGTHISYITLGIMYLLIKSKVPRRLSYFIINLVLIFFMFIAGFSPSVVRASIMGILVISSKLIYRKADTLVAIAISLIIILIYNPFCIQDIGLQLSYLGTLRNSYIK